MLVRCRLRETKTTSGPLRWYQCVVASAAAVGASITAALWMEFNLEGGIMNILNNRRERYAMNPNTKQQCLAKVVTVYPLIIFFLMPEAVIPVLLLSGNRRGKVVSVFIKRTIGFKVKYARGMNMRPRPDSIAAPFLQPPQFYHLPTHQSSCPPTHQSSPLPLTVTYWMTCWMSYWFV